MESPVPVAVNQLELTAELVERGPLRMTPAGVPVVDGVLMHTSEQPEAGSVRKVSVRVACVAIGPMAEQLNRLSLGQPARFSGFLTTPVRRGAGVSSSTRLVFHLQGFMPIARDNPF